MTKAELYKKLNYLDHTRDKRWEMAKQVIANPDLVFPLLEIAFMVDDPVSTKAIWAVEYATKNDLKILLPHLNYFTKNLHTVYHESAIRPMAKMCELIMIDYFKRANSISKNYMKDVYLERISTACFDWLIGNHKVAPKAHSMTCLLLIGSKFSWIHPELKMILEQNYVHGSAAYKARARMTLAKLK